MLVLACCAGAAGGAESGASLALPDNIFTIVVDGVDKVDALIGLLESLFAKERPSAVLDACASCSFDGGAICRWMEGGRVEVVGISDNCVAGTSVFDAFDASDAGAGTCMLVVLDCTGSAEASLALLNNICRLVLDGKLPSYATGCVIYGTLGSLMLLASAAVPPTVTSVDDVWGTSNGIVIVGCVLVWGVKIYCDGCAENGVVTSTNFQSESPV